MDSKEKTAFILLLDKNDGIITIFAQNLNCKQGVFESPYPLKRGTREAAEKNL